MSTSPTLDRGDNRVRCTRVLIAFLLIVIVCLISYSEEVHEMKQSVSSSLSARSSKLKNSSQASASSLAVTWKPSDQVCQWQPDHQECLQLLRSRIPPPYHNRRWAFFGDSTMTRLAVTGKLTTLLNPHFRECKCQRKNAGRCDMYKTFGFQKAATWTPPRRGREGPHRYGLEHPQCQDCSGCNSQLAECTVVPCNASTMSFFSVEVSRDVEIQTTVTNTTQDTVSLYMEQQQSLQYPFTCVVSTGFHDMSMENTTTAIIMENIDWYLGLLRRHCVNLIFLQMTSTLDNPQYAQKTLVIQHISGLVVDLLSKNETMRDWATIVDPFELSKNWTHVDNVHMDNNWYQKIADLFVQLANTQ